MYEPKVQTAYSAEKKQIYYNLLILYAKNGVLFISLLEFITKISFDCK